MSVIFSSEELTAVDRLPLPVSDLDLVSLGHEFVLDESDGKLDLSDLECQPLLAAALPLNSETQGMQSTSHL